nr:C13 family peptidase [uncultured Marinifilum sp.]
MKHYIYLLLILMLCFSCENKEDTDEDLNTLESSFKVAVFMPLSGSMQSDWERSLEWVQTTINENEGVAGKKIDLEWFDSQAEDIDDLAERIAKDTSFIAAIGPFTSANAFKSIPYFIKNKKPLFIPTASSSEITTAYVGKDYVWRFVESDISQCKNLVLLAKEKNVKSIALVTGDDQYGMSFYNWFGFFAAEMSIEVTRIEQYNSEQTDISNEMQLVLSSKPDLIVCIPSNIDQAVEMAKNWKSDSNNCQFLFSDLAYMPQLLNLLGEDAEGIEGTVCIPDPRSGFEIEYEIKYGEKPLLASAQLYDALMLLAYGIEKSGGEGGEKLNTSIKKVVSGRGESAFWDDQSIVETLANIKNGLSPDIMGASGSLEYDNDFFLDILYSTYAHWQVNLGNFVSLNYYSDKGDKRYSNTSASWRTYASQIDDLQSGESYDLPEKKDLKVLLIASSKSWKNYRHQADVLAMYQHLKANGVSDDDIVLILEDDIAFHDKNRNQGSIIVENEGNNLYENIEIDYFLKDINTDMIFDILSGNISKDTPIVLQATKQSNILFYNAGHGFPEGLRIDATNQQFISPEEFKAGLNSFNNKGNFRRMLIVLESCYSGLMGEVIDFESPILCITAANKSEVSKAINYSNYLNVWLSDNFSTHFLSEVRNNPDISFSDLYTNLNQKVNGSHVGVYNEEHFGNMPHLQISEFFNP